MRPILAAVAVTASIAAADGADMSAAAMAADASARPATSTIFLPFGKGVSIDTAVDAALVASITDHEAWLVDMRDNFATMVDTFDTNPAAGGHCHAGKERYVRVLDLALRQEIFHMLIESCAKAITVADPPVTWDEDGSGFTIHLTSAPPVKVRVDTGAREARIAG